MDAEIHWVHFADNVKDGLPEDEDYAIASALGLMFKIGAEVEQDLQDKTYAFLDWIADDL